tara:strand:+ start:78 stop:695 length:618 start_codon:yes stop_codon:yes gene_type:complete
MDRILLASLALSASFTPLASAADADRIAPVTLAHAVSTFGAVDADDSGFLSSEETGKGSIPSKDHHAFDVDLDAHLNEGEYLIYYHGLLQTAGRAIAPDLIREVTRLRAAQRAKELNRQAAASARVKALTVAGRLEDAEALEWSTALWAPFDGPHPCPAWRHAQAVQQVRAALVDLGHEGVLTPDEIDETEHWLALREAKCARRD